MYKKSEKASISSKEIERRAIAITEVAKAAQNQALLAERLSNMAQKF